MLDALKVLFILTGASTYLVTKYIRIGIGDKNDNPPYFDQAQYEAEVNEDEDIQNSVISVTAKDTKGELPKIRHEITRGNIGAAFAVKNETGGAIYPAPGPLEYENRKEYKLRLVAPDNLNENYTTVLIHMKDVNNNPPAFDRPTYETQITEEDDRILPRRVLQVTASDGDRHRPQNIVYFLTGQGVDDENPADRKFAMNSTTGEIYVLKPLDRDLPHGRSQWRFTVFAEDEGANGLVGYADVIVNLKDINDNAPFFPYSIYTGNVTENGTAGMNVMTMTATDYDDPNEGSNAKLTYSIEQNQANENHELIFTIDEDSGVISTAVCCLDREANPEYAIKVVATDGSGLKGTATATIKIKDINDMPPSFTKSEWFVQVDETEGDSLPELPILVVSVNDGDLLETNRFSYKVVEGHPGSDKFTMVTNSDGTGSLKVAKALDFEDPNQRWGFNLTIRVSDHGPESTDPYHTDYAKVYIRLRDINDNKPEFEKANIEVQVPEDSHIGTSLARFAATDVDEGGRSKVTYAIDRASDRRRHFSIDPQGVISIQRLLDREDVPRHTVKILAIDDGMPSRTATATLSVLVTDINDNAPRFLKDYRAVVREHSPPQKIQEILATDEDDRSKGNGPPFTFAMDPDAPDVIKRYFEIQHEHKGAKGDGMAIVSSKGSFDREQQKEYLVPIIIKDSGSTSMTGTSTLTVVIGDINDNRMYSGSKTITVYTLSPNGPSNNGQNSVSSAIGRVHVEDLDDWDLPDKSFFWQNHRPHPKFELNKDTGMITMHEIGESGTFFLQFTVYDRKHTQEVNANVTVVVKQIPSQAVYNSGSIRISGITAEHFIRTPSNGTLTAGRVEVSMYDKLKDILSRILKVDAGNIDIFTVSTKSERPAITDVRFAARGSGGGQSTYYKSEYLDATVTLNRDIIAQSVGINIAMVGIDECLDEGVHCDGSCSNQLTISNNNPLLLVNANETSFVGVNAFVNPSCTCSARDFSQSETCSSHPCLNGGSCTDSQSVGPLCTCPDGYDGPRCEMTTISFNGQGWAWFRPLEQCEESHLSVEIMTRTSTGLILYNGPMVQPNSPRDVSDFISLELFNGTPRLLIDYGSGTAEIVVNTLGDLHDGNWHRLDVFWNREKVRLVVDHCQGAQVDDREPAKIDRSRCENETTLPLYNEFLNVNTPLQLGGIKGSAGGGELIQPVEIIDATMGKSGSGYFNNYWKYQHAPIGFSGCIKNLIHNSVMYDLGSPGSYLNSAGGCQACEESCKSNSITRRCKEGTCIATYNSARCQCKPGWFGSRCDKRTQSKLFQQSSYIKYALSFDPDPYKTDIQLNFRTRNKHGELFRVASKHGREYCVLEIRDKKIRFRFNLNNVRTEERQLTLPHVTVSDGQWHTVQVLRYGSTASISLDGGGGRRYSEINDYAGLHQLMTVEKQNVIAGGDVQYVAPGQTLVDNDLHDGCINDIRLDQRYLPMENGSENAAVVEFKNLLDGCPSNNPCHGILCQRPFVCVDQWMIHECRCERGYSVSADGRNCTDSDECVNSPCLNGGVCKNLDRGEGFYCLCPEGFAGELCNALKQEKIMRLSTAALAAILICLVNILILVLVIVAYSRSRRPDQKFSLNEVDDDVRENIITYEDEGGGEDDIQAFDITSLRIAVDATGTPLGKGALSSTTTATVLMDKNAAIVPPPPRSVSVGGPLGASLGPHVDIGVLLQHRIEKLESDANVPPFDDLRSYAYEGCGSTAGSLSSLNSLHDDLTMEHDLDYLNNWGPRFAKLADMCIQHGLSGGDGGDVTFISPHRTGPN